VAHRAISLLSLVAHGNLALRSRSRPTLLRPPQPAPTFAEGRRQDAGHKVQLVQRCIVVFCDGLAQYLIFLVQL
jgi:hypothetical protein